MTGSLRLRLLPPTGFPRELPVIALRDGVLFPDEISEVAIGRPASVAALRAADRGDGLVIVLAQRSAEVDEPTPADLHEIGCVARILSLEPDDEAIAARLAGAHRGRVQAHLSARSHPVALVAPVSEPLDADPPLDAMLVQFLRDVARRTLIAGGWPSDAAEEHVTSVAGPGRLADVIAGALSLRAAEKQRLLETISVAERVRAVLDFEHLPFEDVEEERAPSWIARLFR